MGRKGGRAVFTFLFDPIFMLFFLFHYIKIHHASEANASFVSSSLILLL